ncbi:MAG TPA: O-antigen ligase family protein [Gemmatimonadales bacterium]|nr:O-antigen ligase family protein [Gemmatimonadales bacterium]
MSTRAYEVTDSVELLLRGGLYLLVASIPFEYPDRTIPLEIPTLTGAVFLLTTLFHPQRCYGTVPAATLWFGVYLLAFLVSTIIAGEHASDAILEFIVVLQGVLIMLAAGNLMRDSRVATGAMVTLVAACVIRASLPLLGLARTTSSVWTGGERVSALGQNANSAAMILAAGMVVLVGLTYGRHRRSWWGLVFASGFAAVIGYAVLETGSRGGLVALLGGMLVFALAAESTRARLRNAVIGSIAMSLLVFGALQLPVMKNRWEDSMRTGNMAGREQLYPALWNMFREKPVFGWGPVSNQYELAVRIGERERSARAAHNIVLELLTATGLIGTIPFLIGGWLCLRQAWHARRSGHGVLPLAFFGSVFLSNMSGDWIAGKLIWLMLAVAVASAGWSGVIAPHRPFRSSRAALVPVPVAQSSRWGD